MQGSQLSANRAFRASKPHNGAFRAPIAAQRCRSRATVQVNAFFNFLQPKQAAAGTNPKAKELAQELLEIASQTRPGTAVPPVTKAEIEELVAELEPLCMKNPLKSPLLWGTYEVVYCSKPSAVGGPLTKGAGPVVAAGQQARQILQEPGTLVNEVTFKTLGLLPGFSRQYGQIQPLSGDTFLLSIKEGEISTGPVKQSKSFDIERKIKIVYLDEDLRIARFLPSDELADSEQDAAEGGPEEEEILFVFQRVAEGEEEEEEEEEEEVAEEEEEQERPTSPIANLFGGTRKVESLATQAERRVQEQRTRKGTQPFFLGGRSRDAEEDEEEEQEDPRAARARAQAERRAAQEQAKQEAAAARSAEQARAAKERERAEREKEAERARAQREKEAEARARAQQEAREAAEAEKAARAERQGQIRELLAELSDELKGAQGEAREAAKEAREVARDNQAVLKQVSAAEAAIAEAERDVQQVSAALEEAIAARKNVEQQVKAAQQSVREAEAAYKQKVGAR